MDLCTVHITNHIALSMYSGQDAIKLRACNDQP